MTDYMQLFQELLGNQMRGFAGHLADQYPDTLDRQRLLEMANDHCAGLDLLETAAALPKKTKRSKSPRSRTSTPIEPDEQCMARIWGTGSGLDQCSKRRQGVGEYCTRHGKAALLGVKACQVAEGSKLKVHVPNAERIGLWCGRIDEFQEGLEGIPPYRDADGIVRIEWDTDEFRTQLELDLAEGVAKMAAPKSPKTRRKKKSPTTPEIVQLLDDAEKIEESTPLTDALAVVSNLVDLENVGEEPDKVEVTVVDELDAMVDGLENDEEVKGEEPAKVDEPAKIEEPVVDGLDAMVDDLENDEEIQVEEWVHDGTIYAVDPNTKTIYDPETGEEIGAWDGKDEATGTPVLN